MESISTLTTALHCAQAQSWDIPIRYIANGYETTFRDCELVAVLTNHDTYREMYTFRWADAIDLTVIGPNIYGEDGTLLGVTTGDIHSEGILL